MSRRLSFVIALAMLSPIAFIVAAYAEETPAEPLALSRPSVPATAAESLQEGWIQVEVNISAEGTVTAAKVVGSYPRGLLDDVVLRAAKDWKFKPHMKDGVAVPEEGHDVSFVYFSGLYNDDSDNSPRGGHVRGVSTVNYQKFSKLLKALSENDIKSADVQIDGLRENFNANRMTVTDVARYFSMLARYERLREHYLAASSAARSALTLARFLDNSNVVWGIHLEQLISYAGMGQLDTAVDYYDSWRKIAKLPIPKEIADYMESLRAQGHGKGRAYHIVDYDEEKKRFCRDC